MSESDGLFLGMCVCVLACAVVVLARRVASLEEDAELAGVAAGNPGSLLDSKRALEKWRDDRVAERSRA